MTDLRHLPGAAQLELRVYERVLRSRLLTPDATATIKALHAHERAHAGALRTLGAPATAKPETALTGRLRTQADCLKLLITAEEFALGACYDAIEHLTDARALRVATAMMGAEAQHRTVLSELLHPGDVMAALPASRVIGIGIG
jgi:hypothetical protein